MPCPIRLCQVAKSLQQVTELTSKISLLSLQVLLESLDRFMSSAYFNQVSLHAHTQPSVVVPI